MLPERTRLMGRKARERRGGQPRWSPHAVRYSGNAGRLLFPFQSHTQHSCCKVTAEITGRKNQVPSIVVSRAFNGPRS